MTPAAPMDFVRHRRLRMTTSLRDLFREHRLHVHDLIAPLFVTDNRALAGPIESLSGIQRYHLSDVVAAVREITALGIRGVLVFGVPESKDDIGSGAWNTDGIVAQCIRAITAATIDITVIADVCLCQYTTHGHCGVLRDSHIANDETLELLAITSLEYAKAGASMVAPSGMMDGAVQAIRAALDQHGYGTVGILSYAVKHASALYGPFREAARSTPVIGDRKSHQLDSANGHEALREAASDIAEGADVIMVKPALTNLDTLVRLRAQHPAVPLAAYEVSGEYAMVQAAAERGWLNARQVTLETLTAIKRAGASVIITYSAVAVARWLQEDAAQ